jgi:uncharacterized protein YndB with AHSA1/START domain
MEANHANSTTITNIGNRDFVIERIFDAPRELVFKVFTEAEHLARWWAPGNYTIPVCTIDLRPGGVWHYCMRSPEGDEHWVKSIYREIVQSERVVYTCTFADKDGNIVDVIPEQLGTLTFADYGGKTKLTTRIQLQSAQDLKATIDMGMVEGLTMTFNNLDQLLKEIQSL